jgi:hypothetical protein
VSGSDLTADITIDPPTGFEIRTADNPFSTSNIVLSPSSGSVAATSIDVRFSPATAGSYSDNIVITSTGATTRNVTVSGTAINPPAHFRSLANGTWATVASWEVSTDLESWSAATAAPVVSDLSITIRAGDTITVAANVTADQITIQDDGALYITSGITLTLNNGTGDDLTVENGGTLRLGSAGTGTTPSFGTDAVARIKTGGKIQVNGSGLTTNGTGVHTSNFVYETDSVVEWILGTATFSASGVTFFPNADANTVPIFRIAVAPNGTPGGGSALVVNGKLEIANGVSVTWAGAGTKTFRNGVIGTGTMNQSTTGQFIISGATAELGGATINLGTNGLSITSSAVSLTGNTIFSGGPVSMSGRLTLTSGTLTTGNTFTFTPTASIAGGGSGSISGTYTLQTTLTGSAGLRSLASPVANVALSDMFGSIWTQGFTGADATNGGSNVFVKQGGGASAFTSATNITNTISAGHGVLVGVFADDDYGTEGVQGGFPKTLSVTGTANTGDVAVTTSAWSSGWEYFLAGNPYPTTIDWDLVTKGANVNAIAWVVKPDGNTDSWNGETGDLTNGLIAPFQGFIYAYNGAGSGITFTEASKSTGGSFRGKEADVFAVRLALRDGTRENSAWLQFAEDGTFGRDSKDAVKFAPLSSNIFQLSTLERGSNAEMDIHYLPMLTETLELPLGIRNSTGGNVTLASTDIRLPQGWSLAVRDNSTGASQSVTMDSQIVMNSQNVNLSLIIEPATGTSVDRGSETVGRMELEQNYPNPFNPSTQIRFSLRTSDFARLTVYDVLGREVAVLVNETLPAGSHSVNFDASGFTSGVYLYKLEAGGMVQTKRMTLVK